MESLGEVVKFLDGVVLDLPDSHKSMFQEKNTTLTYIPFNLCYVKEKHVFREKLNFRMNSSLKCLLGMGDLSWPRAILILAFNNKHLWENNLNQIYVGTTHHFVRAIMSQAWIHCNTIQVPNDPELRQLQVCLSNELWCAIILILTFPLQQLSILISHSQLGQVWQNMPDLLLRKYGKIFF